MEILREYAVILVPIIIVEMALMLTALIHVLKHKKYKFGSQVLWIVIVVFFQIIGPIVYFVFGRGEEE